MTVSKVLLILENISKKFVQGILACKVKKSIVETSSIFLHFLALLIESINDLLIWMTNIFLSKTKFQTETFQYFLQNILNVTSVLFERGFLVNFDDAIISLDPTGISFRLRVQYIKVYVPVNCWVKGNSDQTSILYAHYLHRLPDIASPSPSCIICFKTFEYLTQIS